LIAVVPELPGPAPGTDLPMADVIRLFGACQAAARRSKPGMFWNVAPTWTPAFGIVYAVSNFSCVSHGYSTRHVLCWYQTGGGAGGARSGDWSSASGTAATTAQSSRNWCPVLILP